VGRGLRIGRLFGIDIVISASWLVIFAFVTWSLATSWFRGEPWSTTTLWIVSLAAALLLFASVLAHELAHSLVARTQGIPVHSITLFLLGGISTIESEATSPGREAIMAAAGPASSLAIGVACGLAGVVVHSPTVARAVFLYLAYVNLLLAVFNMLPGFPLDGGRVLRSALWAATHDWLRATRWAARAGEGLGYLLMAAGVVFALGGNLVGGLWLALIGWFVVQSSAAAFRLSNVESQLTGVPARRLMSLPGTWIPGDLTLRTAANAYLRAPDSRCLPVRDDDGSLEGLICLSDLERSDKRSWGVEHVQDVMTGLERLQTVSPDDPAATAFHRLATSAAGELAVMEDGRLVGFIDRTSITRYLRVRGRHGGPPPPVRPRPAPS
jgi:Zn-dependent protease